MKIKQYTLCNIIQGEHMLLGYKKIGFGAGFYNGFGGKVEEGETIKEAAVREVIEEAGVEPVKIFKAGILEFTFSHKPDEILEGHVYRGEGVVGEPTESNEMRPEWFLLESIPYDQMWPGDTLWLPKLIEGKQFTGKLHFDENNNLLEIEVIIVDTLH